MRPILAGVSRHAGETRIFLGVVTPLVTAALVAPVLAGDNRAQKVDFLDLDSAHGSAPSSSAVASDARTAAHPTREKFGGP